MSVTMTRTRKLFFEIVLGAIALATILASAESAEIPRIGVLLPAARVSASEVGLRGGLREQGYVEGRDIVIAWRGSSNSIEDARPHVAELVRAKVDLIAALSTSTARAAMEATSTIPIVFVSSDPVAAGLAESLAKPGANATGVSVMSPELAAKRLDLLQQLMPHARRIAFLRNPSNASVAMKSAEAHRAARRLGMHLETFDARNTTQIETALRAIRRSAPDAILVDSDLVLLNESAKIVTAIRKARIPAVFPWREYHEHGALLSYGPDYGDVMRRAASYVIKILRGAKPANLPVEEISKFDLVIDLRVAREMNIEVPQSLLLRADELIR
jgi:putative tryptophan/tyrosine transport system substrate-binding protein